MIKFLIRVWALIDRAARIRFALFAVGAVVIAVLEAFALGLIVPLTQLLLSQRGEGLPHAARLVDRFIDVSSANQAAAVLGVVVMITFVVKGVSALALQRWAIGNALRQEARISQRLFAQYVMAPYSFHLSRNSAEIQRTLNESMMLVFRRTLPFILSAGADMLTLLAIAGVIVVSDVGIAVIAIVYFIGVAVVYQRFIGGKQKVAARRAHREVAVRYRQVQESVRATKELAILHRQEHFVDRFYDTKLQLVDAQRTLIFYQLLPRHFLDLALVFGAALMTTYAFATRDTREGLAAIGLFLAASFRLAVPLNRIMSSVTLARTAEPGLEQIIHDLAELDALRPSRSDVPTGRLGPSAVELVDVRFRYDESDADVIDRVSLRIEPGDDVGIVGASGAGKTTLLNLILGLLDPNSGDVRVGEKPLSECRTDWQLSIGFVPQEVVLIDDTIRANVAFGIDDRSIDASRLQKALHMAQIEAFIGSLPDGLDTAVGENGVRLSGGQAQRLGLARALYHEPSLLVLDEATSALDSDTESRIIDTIVTLRGSLTLISVSHRLSTLKHCDRIYFLRGGGLAAVGRFDELSAKEPDFAKLVAMAQMPVTTADGPRMRRPEIVTD